jgi:hypothetical protein
MYVDFFNEKYFEVSKNFIIRYLNFGH